MSNETLLKKAISILLAYVKSDENFLAGIIYRKYTEEKIVRREYRNDILISEKNLKSSINKDNIIISFVVSLYNEINVYFDYLFSFQEQSFITKRLIKKTTNKEGEYETIKKVEDPLDTIDEKICSILNYHDNISFNGRKIKFYQYENKIIYPKNNTELSRKG